MRLLPAPDATSRAASLHLRRAAGHGRSRARRCCASAASRRATRDAAVGEPARVGHLLLRRSCKAGGVVVPVDWQSSAERGAEPRAAGRARGPSCLSDKVRERLDADVRARGLATRGRRDHPLRRPAAGRAAAVDGGGAGAPPEGRRPGVAHLHLGHDREAQGRDAHAPQLHVAAVASSPASSTSTSTTALLVGAAAAPHLRVLRRPAHAAHARRADHLPRGARRRRARATRFEDGRHHRHGRRAGAVAAARSARSTRTSPIAGALSSKRIFDLLVDCNRALRDQMPPALDGLTLLNWASCCSGRCTASSAAGCACSSRAARRCRPRR